MSEPSRSIDAAPEISDGLVDLRESLGPVADLVVTRARVGDVVVVGLAGGVAAGKTVAAGALASVLSDRDGLAVEVVSTDGFLFPNAELDRLGLTARKGFPESYDRDALVGFITAVRKGRGPVAAPQYDHLTYDVQPDEPHLVAHVDVVILEGVNVLQEPFADRLDLAVYLHADELDVRRWYHARIRRLRAEAPGDGSSFYDAFAGMSDDEFAVVADVVWESVNRPNLVDHIEPTRAHADVVIEKAADHSIRSLAVRLD